MNKNNNNDEDVKGKKSPTIEVDPITGKITVKETEQESGADVSGNKDAQQSRKKMIEPHHSPDDPEIEEEKEKKKNIFLNLSQRILGNQSRNINKRNLDIAQNIGERMNKLGIKFLGHLSVGRTNQLSPNTPNTGQNIGKDKDNEREI